jgi:predicted glycoside hydrolase/deacetylase ChbG (UPF0249 family)
MLRRIIVNADDFGLTEGVNRGISEARQRGVVSSTSFIANGSGFDDAVRMALNNCGNGHPPLSIGCHIVLVDGRPLLGREAVESLLGEEGGGAFRRTFFEFVLSAMGGMLSAKEIEAEATAQIQKIQGMGISISHVDTHKHAHLFPAVIKPILRAAKACGIRAIRNPFYTNCFPEFGAVRRNPKLAKRYLQVPLLRRFAVEFRRLVDAEGLATTDGCVGVYEPALADAATLERVLRRVPEGTWELVCHPGYVDEDLKRVKTRLKESRTAELDLLTSRGVREIFEREGIEIISYRDL